jgi:hypothetical protein
MELVLYTSWYRLASLHLSCPECFRLLNVILIFCLHRILDIFSLLDLKLD